MSSSTVIAMLGFSSLLCWGGDSGTIHGTVRTENGAPAAGAQVTARNAAAQHAAVTTSEAFIASKGSLPGAG
jgi:hypothetical protein